MPLSRSYSFSGGFLGFNGAAFSRVVPLVRIVRMLIQYKFLVIQVETS